MRSCCTVLTFDFVISLYIFKELNCSSYDVTVVQEEEDETSSLQTESIDIENGMVFIVKSFVVLFL